jgi:hypothetical protein
MTQRPRLSTPATFLAAACLMLGTLIAALPSTAHAEVRDGVKFFSERAVREADALIRQIRERHGKDVVVETIPSLPGVPQGDAQRMSFYEAEVARRGGQAGLNGVYIFATGKPRYLYAGVDPQTQKDKFTLDDRRALRDLILTHFQKQDFDRGLIEGLQLIDQRMGRRESSGAAGAAGAGAASSSAGGTVGTGDSSPPAGSNAPAPGPAGQGGGTPTGGGNRVGLFSGVFGWLCLIAGALIVFTIIRGFARRRAAMAQGYGQPGYGQTGQPGYGQPGYDPRYGGPQPGMGGGGGFGRGILGGILGGMAGGALYDHMRGGGSGNEANAATPSPQGLDPSTTPIESPDPGFDTGGGGSFEPTDMGGGGDFGGGDSGGGGDF